MRGKNRISLCIIFDSEFNGAISIVRRLILPDFTISKKKVGPAPMCARQSRVSWYCGIDAAQGIPKFRPFRTSVHLCITHVPLSAEFVFEHIPVARVPFWVRRLRSPLSVCRVSGGRCVSGRAGVPCRPIRQDPSW